MGLQIRDERQMKALTGLSQAQFDYLLPVFSDIYRVQPSKQRMKKGSIRHAPASPWRWIERKTANHGEKLQFVLYYYKTYLTFDVLDK